MSLGLILSDRLKEVTYSYVFQRIFCILANKYLILMGFGSKCSILNGQVVYNKISKLNFADPCDSFPLIVSGISLIILYWCSARQTRMSSLSILQNAGQVTSNGLMSFLQLFVYLRCTLIYRDVIFQEILLEISCYQEILSCTKE